MAKRPLTASKARPLFTTEEGKLRIESWFEEQSWTVLQHQREAWEAIAGGQSGLIEMPTGAGKTYAVLFGFLPELGDAVDGLRLLYVTPLRALTRDIEIALRRPCEDLGLQLRIESRTGDTSNSLRRKQKKELPHILITTPESLALLLSYEHAAKDFADLKGIILDEWHELLGSKRGSLLELSLARLRHLSPQARTWALSATLPNREEAAATALGRDRPPYLIRSSERVQLEIETLAPPPEGRLPWAGHLGLKMVPEVLLQLDPGESTLLFTNTRSQAERWHEAIMLSRPEWEGQLALHHGSLALEEREHVERGVKEGRIRCVVCTASLDLGVDFPEVDRVIQIGSPKRISRLIQRAGRSNHAPGLKPRLLFVPTHALELVEIIACRQAIERGEIEARRPLRAPLDVLVQHLVNCALGGGFEREAMWEEVRTAYSFADLDRESFEWALDFIVRGGGTLAAYPQYCRVQLDGPTYRVLDKTIALRHRQNIGTIVSDASMQLKLGRRSLGTVEEAFIAKLHKGDQFLFGGRWLQLVSVKDLTAYTRLAKGSQAGLVPAWYGTSLPWSTLLSNHVRGVFDQFAQGSVNLKCYFEAEALSSIEQSQSRLSAWPRSDQLLIERVLSREGYHFFFYPCESRSVHEGLAALLVHRISRDYPGSFSVAANDYGFEVLSTVDVGWSAEDLTRWLSPEDLEKDLRAALNQSELARRQFREIARVAGLVFQNLPGRQHSNRQLQSSSGLLFDVLQRFDPTHRLLAQATQEVLQQQFEWERLQSTLQRIKGMEKIRREPPIFSPLGLPLYIERVSARVSTEDWNDRLERIKDTWKTTYQSLSQEKSSSSSRPKRSSGRAGKPS
jgi:ATP-dependent Lhr-like helicase